MSFFAPNPSWPERAQRKPYATAGLRRLMEALVSMWQRWTTARPSRERRLQVVERIHLGDKQFIALLELDGQTLLAAGAPGAPLQIASSQALCPRQANAPTLEGQSAGKQPSPVAPPAMQEAAASVSAANAWEDAARTPVPAQAGNMVQPVVEPEQVPASRQPSGSLPPKTAKKMQAPKQRAAGEANARVPAKKSSSLAAARPAPSPAPADTSAVAGSPPARQVRTAPTRTAGREPAKVSPAPAVQQARTEKPARKPRRKQPIAPAETLAVPKPSRSPDDPVLSIASAKRKAAPEPMRRKAPAEPASMPQVQRRAKPALEAARPTEAAREMDQPDPKLDPTFAALLHLRMLATEAFGEVDTQAAAAPVPPPPPQKPARLLRRLSISACFLGLMLFPHAPAHAAALPTVLAAVQPAGNDIRITGLGGSSAPWSIVVVLTLLTLLPSLLFCITPFARLLIVFHFLRQALGLQTTPSNQTLIGLSLILTFFLMQPTGEVIYRDAVLPAQAGKLTPLDAVVRAGEPMRHFMAHYVREKDAQLFLEIAHEPRPRTVDDLSFRVMLPAYILSELKAGFQIGTVLFLPFLIVDMVVASITTSVGMVQLPPVVISTPLKLLLFLMVDGWHLLIGSLMRSFN